MSAWEDTLHPSRNHGEIREILFRVQDLVHHFDLFTQVVGVNSTLWSSLSPTNYLSVLACACVGLSLTCPTSPPFPGLLPSFLLRIIDATRMRTMVQSESKLVHSVLNAFALESDTFQILGMSMRHFFTSTIDSAGLSIGRCLLLVLKLRELTWMVMIANPRDYLSAVCSLSFFFCSFSSFLFCSYFYGKSTPRARSVSITLGRTTLRCEFLVLGFFSEVPSYSAQ